MPSVKTLAATAAIGAGLGALAWSHFAYAQALDATGVGEALRGTVWWGVLACLGYLLVVYGLYVGQLLFAVAESVVRNRELRAEDIETIEESQLTAPVTCIVPVYNEDTIVIATVRALLAQNYPEYEVVVIDDGSTDGTFERLCEAFDLAPLEVSPRNVFEASEVLSVHRSNSTDARVTVVRKANGGNADALNCGINFASYPYILTVDGDTLCRPDALMKGMRLALHDPEVVVGVASHIAISYWPEQANRAPIGERRVDRSLLSNFQLIDFMRSFLASRLAWSRFGFMLCAAGAFTIWRRDVLEEVGGFSRDFSCGDIELTFRVHEKYLREHRVYKILSLPDTVATTEGPNRVEALIKQRARWQRAIMETVWHYQRLLGNPRYKTVGLIGAPYFLTTEVLAPFFEMLSVVLLLASLWLDLLDWLEVVAVLGIMAFVSALLTATAVQIEDATSHSYRLRDLARLLALGPLELFAYRPILMFARAKGAWDFFHGRRNWDDFDRNQQPQPAGEDPTMVTAP